MSSSFHIYWQSSQGWRQSQHPQHLHLHQLHLFAAFCGDTWLFMDLQPSYPLACCLFQPSYIYKQFWIVNIHQIKIMSEDEKHSIKLEPEIQNKGQDDIENQGEGVVKCESEGDADAEGEIQVEQDEHANSGNLQQGGSMPEGASQQMIKKRAHKKLDISNFIMKTYKILEDKRNSSIVEWTDEGNCFIVKDKEKFSRQILPKYFKHSKFSSFVRQLNMYDFHKIRKEKEIPIFKHKYFKEGMMDQLHKIKRKNGDEGRDEEGASKEAINFSEPLIGLDNPSKQLISLKSKISTQQTAQSEIEFLRRQNMELTQSLHELNQQIQLLEVGKEKKKEKLMKIISSLMFFDLNLEEKLGSISTLRQLQEHFTKDQEPLTFSEYRQNLSNIYVLLKNRLMM